MAQTPVDSGGSSEIQRSGMQPGLAAGVGRLAALPAALMILVALLVGSSYLSPLPKLLALCAVLLLAGAAVASLVNARRSTDLAAFGCAAGLAGLLLEGSLGGGHAVELLGFLLSAAAAAGLGIGLSTGAAENDSRAEDFLRGLRGRGAPGVASAQPVQSPGVAQPPVADTHARDRVEAGWYPQDGLLRWWDGQQWTVHTRALQDAGTVA